MTQSDNKYETNLVAELAAIMDKTGLTEIELERADFKLRLGRELYTEPNYAPVPPPIAAPLAAAPTSTSSAQAPASEVAKPGKEVTSPMVGTIYLSASPETENFIKVGDKVAQGATLLTIEAMKTFNEVHAPFAGEVIEILVVNEEPVEFGQALVRLG